VSAKFAGGTRVDSAGYLVIKAGPHRDKRVHILVAEAMLKRKLLPDEDVDHYNGDKLDCEWTNLRVRGKSEHGAVSNRQKWFLEHREEHERKQWEEWISEGGVRPDLGKLDLGEDEGEDEGDTSFAGVGE
jgi:hypothetical protein